MTHRRIRTPMGDRRIGGQTLVVAVIVLGVLLVLGFAFAGVIARNVTEGGRSEERSDARGLAEAGAEFAHDRLVRSALGADWRPEPTPLVAAADGTTRDPDAHWLRSGTGFSIPGDAPGATGVVDLGGPDGLGPFSRVFFDGGRALIRVRYSPSDLASATNPTGDLRRPGLARNHLVVESVGRAGELRTSGRIDPSLQLPEAVPIEGFADSAELVEGLATLARMDATTPSRKLTAFASIGVIETARFVTNKHRVSRPAELGVPTPTSGVGIDSAGIGADFGGVPVAHRTQWGGELLPGVAGSGSLYVNGDLVLHGRHDVAMNQDLGDLLAVSGSIRPANSGTVLNVTRTSWDPATSSWVTAPTVSLGPNAIDSSGGFDTLGGLLRDGVRGADAAGFARGVPRKEPPSVVEADPRDGSLRYMTLTRESGVDSAAGNTGEHGWGRGIFVDAPERGNVAGDAAAASGAVRSLPDDWLNPGNPDSDAWRGPYYMPIAASLRLLPDGFEISRDARSVRPTWRDPFSGADTGEATVRYRLRRIGSQVYVISSLTSLASAYLPAGSIDDAVFLNEGLPFEGVIAFGGDVRVRGVIPTDLQLTVVAMGTAYVDGSITKGVVDAFGQALTRPSRSAMSLLAQDHVALNATMFFGPASGESPRVADSAPLPDAPSPLELDFDDANELSLNAQFLLRPDGANPSAWQPYALSYAQPGGGAIFPNLLLSSSADDGGPAYVSMGIGPRSFADGGVSGLAAFFFPRSLDFGTAGTIEFNAAGPLFGNDPLVPLYGMADPSANVFPRFGSTTSNLLPGGWTYDSALRQIVSTANPGAYRLAVQDETELRLRAEAAGLDAARNPLLGRAAITPHDVRIEAALYAEEGSFYVIPGPWFNPNAGDTRERFEDAEEAFGADEANRQRYANFGSSPETPFYGEPLAVKVRIVGALSENMPAPMSDQSEWLRKWGWIPGEIGSSGIRPPASFADSSEDLNLPWIPNLTVVHDPALATATSDGVTPLRTDAAGRTLPPTPRLPVSPTLSYFGEVNL